MANVIIPPEWRIADSEATPESVYLNRRAFLKSSGMGMAALGFGACGSEFTPSELVDEIPEVPVVQAGCDDATMLHPLQSICPSPTANLYPAVRTSTFDVPGPDQTDRIQAAVFNNFYEFIGSVHRRIRLRARPRR